ncbi:MAG TPA: hypothetical protein VLC28_06660, partial [Flavitalea sp.]|nr:hypothetical protein [Flavitalea sp.]
PIHGIFDNDNRLWVMETSDKNEVRVSLAQVPAESSHHESNILPFVVVGSFIVIVIVAYAKFGNQNKNLLR